MIEKNLKLPDHLRPELKKPFGLLLTGSQTKIINELQSLIQKINPPKIIAVGDVTALTLYFAKIQPNLSIIDEKVERFELEEPVKKMLEEIPAKKIEIENPAGQVTVALWKAIESALKENEPIKVLVKGEEDLATIPAVILASERSIIIYGQPEKGVVVIEANADKKKAAEAILNQMLPVE